MSNYGSSEFVLSVKVHFAFPFFSVELEHRLEGLFSAAATRSLLLPPYLLTC